MFSSLVQPSTVSLFSSTGSLPLQLFETRNDTTLPEDSFVHLLNDTTNIPAPPAPAKLVPIHTGQEGLKDSKTLIQTRPPHPIPDTPYDLHSINPRGLGLKHPWVHVQSRDLGKEWSFEIGVADQANRVGVVRLSTFQREPRLDTVGPFPLLHLPLIFPQRTDEYSGTTWSTIDLNLPRLLSAFTSPQLIDENHPPPQVPLPSSAFSHVVYVRVYATCRLRRIWFSQSGPSQKSPWEFDLYGCDPAREQHQ
uniref:CFA20 domain-containing protein n=1 Tax=Schizophyllum commune (strain H4-8 / FGSC 9210) TaxID=578458 RepID=D8QEB7_SCHCM